MKHQIYRILDVNECCNQTTGEAVPYLTYDGTVYGDAKIVSRGGKDATLEELVHLCDQDAESRNAHDFCGAHRLLAAVLYQNHGRMLATATMLQIALFGGLQGMTGVCSEGDAYKELNVGKAGFDWNGNFGK